jgi:ribosomal protein S18 acetylase RimI-like enzyme
MEYNQLRLMRDADLPAVDRLLRLAYRNENDFTGRLRRHLALQPDGWLVAESGGALVGAGGATIMGTAGYIGLVGVDPACQRRGIALTLMRSLIAWLRERGCSTILLDASDAGKPLYLRLGFLIGDTVSVWRRQERLTLPPLPREAVAIRPYQERDLPEIIALDAHGYGAPRDRVIEAFITDDPGLASVARGRDGALQGYLIVQPEFHELGPWLAATPDAARALFVDAIARHGALIESVIAPDANHHAAEILRSSGFAPTRTLAHMRLGAPLPSSRRQTIYGQINLALG